MLVLMRMRVAPLTSFHACVASSQTTVRIWSKLTVVEVPGASTAVFLKPRSCLGGSPAALGYPCVRDIIIYIIQYIRDTIIYIYVTEWVAGTNDDDDDDDDDDDGDDDDMVVVVVVVVIMLLI
eukprot:COSAG05_NODE_57_length_23291_cov_75.862668_8_plen_123_part_00